MCGSCRTAMDLIYRSIASYINNSRPCSTSTITGKHATSAWQNDACLSQEVQTEKAGLRTAETIDDCVLISGVTYVLKMVIQSTPIYRS